MTPFTRAVGSSTRKREWFSRYDMLQGITKEGRATRWYDLHVAIRVGTRREPIKVKVEEV
ncbi:hypothetical protein BOTCAL_0260g00010 [Botryotinia calthae]|uniref:Uncharacterized protein n=1 Tax=Botryotinia calthae TaxID=38488 RepID=A0A4Y8CYH6_9HELO|nr:hypothetical protein BOTCAL_0260g00010 [Botryotinia calthae]